MNTESVYLDLTFITLAMLVVGGATSLWGAVVGALAVSALDSYLAVAENGTSFFGGRSTCPPARASIDRRRADGGRPDPAAERPDRRARVPAVAEAMTRVCVAGAGVIGSLFAAHLSRVAEVSALTRREEHASALREQGLRVTRALRVPRAARRGDLTARPARAGARDRRVQGHRPRVRGGAARGPLAGRDRDDGAERDRRGEVVARHGDWRLLTAVTFMSGTRHDDTHVEYVLDTATWIGPGRGTTPDDARAWRS